MQLLYTFNEMVYKYLWDVEGNGWSLSLLAGVQITITKTFIFL